MKVHFDIKTKISPICNRNIPVVNRNKLYTQYNNTIVITDLNTMKILKRIELEEIECFNVDEDKLVICTDTIEEYDIESSRKEEEIAIGKIKIKRIEVIGNKEYVICREDGNIFYVKKENIKIIMKMDVKDISVTTNDSNISSNYDNKDISSNYDNKNSKNKACVTDGERIVVLEEGEIVFDKNIK